MAQPTNQTNQHSWGWSRHLYIGDTTSLSEAVGKASGASSLHFHRDKSNAFIVHEGIIEIWASSSLLAHLRPQQAFVIPADVAHRMVFLTDAVLHELYQASEGRQLHLEDITRLEPGWRPGETEVRSRVDFRGDSAGNPGSPACFPG